MKRLIALSALLLSPAFGADFLFAQSLLNQLEQHALPGAGPASPAGAATSRGYLGAKLDNVDDQGKTGVRVTEVVAGTPAEAGGLKSDDVITAINGKSVVNLD